MKALALAGMSIILLSACATPQPRFEQMSEDELIAYNESVPFEQQVYCRQEVQVGSHIRKRVCVTVQDMLWGTIRSLNTPSSSSSIPYNRF